MTELRRDPIVGQWVNVHIEDSLRPDQYEPEDHTPKHKATCQFCPEKEHLTPPEVDAIRLKGSQANASDWQSRVVPNKFPALKIEGDLNEHKDGLFDMSSGIGAHEVLIETPSHEKNLADYSQEEVSHVIELYQRRLVDLTNDQRFKYVIIFKNYGESAGASVEHAHSQIIALPMIPKHVLEELEGAKDYFDQKKKCIFCDIIDQEQKEQERIIAENDEFIAFCPFVPCHAFEFWIMPKDHQSRFAAMEGLSRNSLASILKETLQGLKTCLSDPSYNYYLHIAPINTDKDQEFHWHIEVVPKLTKTTGFEWGTGFYVVRTSPEAAADYLRNAQTALSA